MHTSRILRSPFVALGESLMVLPAIVLLGAATLRFLQPRHYEPARTSWFIIEWTTAHISRLGAGTLFIGLPCLVAIVGSVTLLTTWRADQAFRHDIGAALAIFRRQRAIVLSMTATLLAGAILAVVVAHLITD